MTEPRIAVVIEDDRDARELTEIVLTQSGFTVVSAVDGPSGIQAVREHNPLLTTLDVQMPGMDGFAVAKMLREFSLTYLIMITSMASEIDVIRGFEAGADDYIVKPFRPSELRARADSMLRRPRNRVGGPELAPAPEPESWAAAAARELLANPLAPVGQPGPTAQPAQPARPAQPAQVVPPQPAPPVQPTPTVQPVQPAAPVQPVAAPAPAPAPTPAPAPVAASVEAIVTVGGLTLDPTTGRTTLDGRGVDLSAPEFELLLSLARTGRRVRSKADLVLALRGHTYVTSHFVNEADKRSVDAHVAALRKKLSDDGATPRVIETVKGVGYRLV